MGENSYLLWLGIAAAAAALGYALARRRGRADKAAPADTGERSPVPVEGTTALAGMHKGVKYWIYFEDNGARLEIETAGEGQAPFVSDGRKGKARLPGDERDWEVRELLRMGAFRVEAAEGGGLVAAYFEARTLNLNSGTRFGFRTDEAVSNKAVELLVAIRDKGRAVPEGSGRP